MQVTHSNMYGKLTHNHRFMHTLQHKLAYLAGDNRKKYTLSQRICHGLQAIETAGRAGRSQSVSQINTYRSRYEIC